MKRLSFLLTMLTSLSTFAVDLRTTTEEKNSSISALAQKSTFTLNEGGEITGGGVKIDFNHHFTPKMSLELFLSTAIGGEDAVSSSFSGFGGYVLYNLFSECCERSRSLFVDGIPVVTESSSQNHVLQVGLGFNQYLLNGSRGVYSISGPGFGVNYIVRVWDFHVKASVQSADVVSGAIKASGSFMGVGLLFNL